MRFSVRTERGPDFSFAAHNLYDRGFAGESGLKIVKPGAVHKGSVSYAVRFQGGFHAR